MSTFPQQCEPDEASDLLAFLSLLEENQNDLRYVLESLLGAVNQDMVDNHRDLTAIQADIRKLATHCIRSNRHDINGIYDELQNNVIHGTADVSVALNVLCDLCAQGRIVPNRYSVPLELPQGPWIPSPIVDAPFSPGTTIGDVFQGLSGGRGGDESGFAIPAPARSIVTNEYSAPGYTTTPVEAQPSIAPGITVIEVPATDNRPGITLNITVNVSPTPVRVNNIVSQTGTIPQTDAFSQAPPTGGIEHAPFNPNMFGDASEESFDENPDPPISDVVDEDW